MMTAPNESIYYINRGKDGSEAVYRSPEQLLSEAVKYFTWCDENPLLKKDTVKSGTKAGETIETPVPRPYTIEGLCVYIGLSIKTLYKYQNKKEFSPAISHIRNIIRQNQMEGAITGAYNASAILRIGQEDGKQEPSGDTADELLIESDSPRTYENLAIIKERLSRPKENYSL